MCNIQKKETKPKEKREFKNTELRELNTDRGQSLNCMEYIKYIKYTYRKRSKVTTSSFLPQDCAPGCPNNSETNSEDPREIRKPHLPASPTPCRI